MTRWEQLSRKEYEHCFEKDGLLNEFKMLWELRESFPLHYIVFKQTASHMAHEANVEQIFSRAGLLADPNLDPSYLATLVKVGYNKKACKPLVQQVKEKYYAMFRGKPGADDAADAMIAAGAAGPSNA